MKKIYPLFDIYWDDDDINAVINVIKRGSHWAVGPEIRDFEVKLQEYLNMKYVVIFNSGTSALHSLLLAYNITSGEVIVPSFSFISTANCVILAGAKPVFAEIEQETLGLDPDDVIERINEKTKAIIPMHYGGNVCKNIEILKEIAEDHNIILIEDNAESFGAKVKEKLAGTIGHAGMLSFCQNKIITTGEGGAICTNDTNIYNNLLLIRSHGRVEREGLNYFSNIYEEDYVQIGYNYRIPTLCAALGISQLKKVEKIITIRRKIGQLYNCMLKDSTDVDLIPETEEIKPVYQLYSILLKKPEKRIELQESLSNNGIITKVYFYPIHLKRYYREKYGYSVGDLPITEDIANRILTLPISLKFNKIDLNYITSKIWDFFD